MHVWGDPCHPQYLSLSHLWLLGQEVPGGQGVRAPQAGTRGPGGQAGPSLRGPRPYHTPGPGPLCRAMPPEVPVVPGRAKSAGQERWLGTWQQEWGQGPGLRDRSSLPGGGTAVQMARLSRAEGPPIHARVGTGCSPTQNSPWGSSSKPSGQPASLSSARQRGRALRAQSARDREQRRPQPGPAVSYRQPGQAEA